MGDFDVGDTYGYTVNFLSSVRAVLYYPKAVDLRSVQPKS